MIFNQIEVQLRTYRAFEFELTVIRFVLNDILFHFRETLAVHLPFKIMMTASGTWLETPHGDHLAVMKILQELSPRTTSFMTGSMKPYHNNLFALCNILNAIKPARYALYIPNNLLYFYDLLVGKIGTLPYNFYADMIT